MKIISNNKKAYHDYFILETFEAGIELKGTEIKSIRKGSANLKDCFVRIKDMKLLLRICILPLMKMEISLIMNLDVLENYCFIRKKLVN